MWLVHINLGNKCNCRLKCLDDIGHAGCIEKNEPEQYQLLLQNQDINPIVKYEYFRKFFAENFKISFGKTKSDTCQKCDKLMNKINAADTEAQKRALETEKICILERQKPFTPILKINSCS
jgi:hypothetical protein